MKDNELSDGLIRYNFEVTSEDNKEIRVDKPHNFNVKVEVDLDENVDRSLLDDFQVMFHSVKMEDGGDSLKLVDFKDNMGTCNFTVVPKKPGQAKVFFNLYRNTQPVHQEVFEVPVLN